jgi:Na+/proline symporter
MTILIIIVIVALLVWAGIEIVNLLEYESPAKDSDILEMLEKCGADYELDAKWNDKFKLKAHWKSSAPSIYQTQYSIIFPYYIDDVGVVPIWYKSAGRIRKIFEEKISASRYDVTKRDKLGLNKK